ncbi:MAG: helicase C-terminal domain-containing protein [Spartobacteria bacterium]
MTPVVFQTSVRELVAFVHRTGGLAGTGAFRASDRALEGGRAHRRVQGRRTGDYEAEVPVEWRATRGSVDLTLSGRIDGLRAKDSPPVVEEIKSVDRFWDGAADPLHLAQLKIYAAILAIQRRWAEVELHLTYLNLETDGETVLPFRLTLAELEEFFEITLAVWFDWLEIEAQWISLRNTSLEKLDFPFEGFRGGQRELARRVYRAIRDGRNLFAEAPTGLGKTMATLFPAAKALPLLGDRKVFFLTAKTPGRIAAAEAVGHLRRAGARLRSLTLTAKNRICFTEDPAGCDPRICPYATGYHDRIKPALRELLERETLDREAVEAVARKHMVCSFELSLDASSWCDIVIGDFNHAFDPSARLQRHFAEGGGRHVILVDEAHNLVDRSRDMHSATLSPENLEIRPGAVRAKGAAKVRRALQAARASLLEAVGTTSSSLIPARDYHDGAVFSEMPKNLLVACREAARSLEALLSSLKPSTDLGGWIEPWFALNDWLRAAEAFDGTCRFLIHPGRQSATVLCADPSPRLRADLKTLRGAVFFSATLSPMDYFQELLGGTADDEQAVFDSPFKPDQMRLRILAADLTYKGRAASLDRVADAVAGHVQGTPGNHLIFCPSLAYLDELAAKLDDLLPAGSLLVQSAGMSESERHAFLEAFQPGFHTIALAVLGGIFAEGVDLPGERLTGVTVIGTGLPKLSLEGDILQSHFEDTKDSGFDYAYRFPGMQRVLQAVGRLIRTETDTGSILLVDRRFLEPRHRVLFPPWWPAPSVLKP